MSDKLPNDIVDTYLSIRDTLRRLILARGLNSETADDLLQEVYLKISSGNFTEKINNPSGYLYKTTNNIINTYFVKMASQKEREKKWVSHQFEKYQVSQFDIYIDGTPDATQIVAAKQELSKLLKTLDQLPPKCRAVYLACKLKDMSHKQAAKEFDIAVSTVEKHIAKASSFIAKRC